MPPDEAPVGVGGGRRVLGHHPGRHRVHEPGEGGALPQQLVCTVSSRVRMNNVLYYLASELELLADVTNI